MKPIFFPFTFLSDPFAGILKTFFDKTIIYQPASGKIYDSIQRGADERVLEIRAPIGGDEQRLESLLYEYRQWLDRQRGSEMTFFKTKLFDSFSIDAIPGFSDTSTSQIKSQIKKMGSQETPQRPDPLFTARFFLWVAQEFDMQHYDINRDLEIFRDMEKELFSGIICENENVKGLSRNIETVITEDPGQYKTFQRMTAWFKLFEQDPVEPDQNGTLFLVSKSRAVLNYLLDLQEDADTRKIVEAEAIPIGDRSGEEAQPFRNNLMNHLDRLSENPSGEPFSSFATPETAGKPTATLEVYAFGKSPWNLLAGNKQLDAYNIQGEKLEKINKTFIGVVEIK